MDLIDTIPGPIYATCGLLGKNGWIVRDLDRKGKAVWRLSIEKGETTIKVYFSEPSEIWCTPGPLFCGWLKGHDLSWYLERRFALYLNEWLPRSIATLHPGLLQAATQRGWSLIGATPSIVGGSIMFSMHREVLVVELGQFHKARIMSKEEWTTPVRSAAEAVTLACKKYTSVSM